MPVTQSRRQFLATLSLAAAAEAAPENHREAGMIKSSPQKIIAEGTDWRFLNEVKREPKV